jgi:hypothetical protein
VLKPIPEPSNDRKIAPYRMFLLYAIQHIDDGDDQDPQTNEENEQLRQDVNQGEHMPSKKPALSLNQPHP